MHQQPNADVMSYEHRRYWHTGTLTDVEWWFEGRLLLRTPQVPKDQVVTTDYCQMHRTRIYPDLGCQYCHERPAQRETRAIATEERRQRPRPPFTGWPMQAIREYMYAQYGLVIPPEWPRARVLDEVERYQRTQRERAPDESTHTS